MKIQKISIAIFFLILSLITCADRRTIFAENIRAYAHSRTKPAKADELVSDYQNRLTILFYDLTLKDLEETKVKFDLSDSLTMQIKTALYARSSGAIKIEEKTELDYSSYEETIGSAIKGDDGKISFALIKTKTFADLKKQYESYYVPECKRKFIFFNKCHDIEKQKERELTDAEKLIINDAVKYSAVNSILEGVEILKGGDYELYMSDTGNIFSPDHQSVAHVTYFGNIAIGPSSELNSLLPIDYQYEFKEYKNDKNNGHLEKKITNNAIELNDYPVTSEQLHYNLIVKKGYFHKFNFLIKNEALNMFPTQYANYIYKTSENGPYVLEVKKNGNVILYQKNDNKILWQTNTANQGKGPYNFHLTNDKILILEDSNGKILYQSGSYKNTPTIFYGNNGINGNFFYNGIKINPDGKSLPLNKLYIKTENQKTSILYGGNVKEINREVLYYSDSFTFSSYEFTTFHAKFANYDDYDICYTVQITLWGWTAIGCNGEEVGYKITENGINNSEVNSYYLQSLVIFLKKKEEPVPQLSKFMPKVKYF